MNLEQQRDTIIDIAARHGARNLRVFGSVARAATTVRQATSTCWGRGVQPLPSDVVGLAQDLEALLHRNVDVVTHANLQDAIRPAKNVRLVRGRAHELPLLSVLNAYVERIIDLDST